MNVPKPIVMKVANEGEAVSAHLIPEKTDAFV